LQQETSAFAETLFIEPSFFRQTADDNACPNSKRAGIWPFLDCLGRLWYNGIEQECTITIVLIA
jgi:hypothetical protein